VKRSLKRTKKSQGRRKALLTFKRSPKIRKRVTGSKFRPNLNFSKLVKRTKRLPNAEEKSLVVQAPPSATPVPQPVVVPPTVQSHELTISQLLRPNEKLKSSMEGFLLDQRSEHTKRAYSKDIKRFVQFLHARHFERGDEILTRTALIAYKDQLLQEKLEHTTIDRHLATLKSFFRWLTEDGHFERNPSETVRFLNPKRVSSTQAFTDAEVQKVLSLPNLHSRIGSQHYAILMILFYCGLRRSEVCELRTSNISEERGQLILRLKGKGNKERIVPLILPVRSALEHFFKITGKRRDKDQYLFAPFKNARTGELNKALDSTMIYYIVTRYSRQAGVANKVSPHSCRATAISNARDHNVADRAIQEFAGWSSPSMITNYDKRKTAIEDSAAHSISYGREGRKLPWVPK